MDPSIFRRYHREYISAPEGEGRGDPRGLAVAQKLENGLVRFGFSQCSKKDSFSKKLARNIAENRMRSNIFIIDPMDMDDRDIMMEDLSKRGFESILEELNWVIERCSR